MVNFIFNILPTSILDVLQMDPPVYHIRMERKQRLDEFAIAKRHVAMNKLQEEFTALGGRHRARSYYPGRRGTAEGDEEATRPRDREDRGRDRRGRAKSYAPHTDDRDARRDDGKDRGRTTKQRFPSKRT